MFALTGTQTENDDRLIRGTCYIADQSLVAIIDTGATCHTLILDLKILIQISLLFSDTFKFAVFSTVLQPHILLLFSPIFLHYKPFKRVSKTIAYFPAFYSIIFA